MSQHDYDLANASGAAFRGDANNALAAVVSNNSGASAPATTFAYMWWVDTTNGLLKQRNAANSAWIIRANIAETLVLSRTSDTILGVADFGRRFIASTTFTQTLTAAATLGDGWHVDYVNDGTGVITLDANGSELIDGATTKKLLPGEGGLLVCNGTAFKFIQRTLHKASAQLLENIGFAVSVAANALTIALKDAQGADPAPGSPVRIGFRSATLTTGTPDVLEITAAASLVISSGSTLGTVSAQAHRLYIVGVNDAGTFRLGIWNPWDNTNKALVGLTEDNLISSTAEGGGGTADSALTLYTGTAVTSKAIRILGYIETTQTTAGTWAAEDSKVQIMGPGVRRTGDRVARRSNYDGAVATGTTTLPDDDTIPQNTEGNQYYSITHTPASAINLLRHHARLNAFNSAGAGVKAMALFQDSTADALAAARQSSYSTTVEDMFTLDHLMVAGTASSTTFNLRAGCSAAGTTTINGASAARKLGGALRSGMELEEIHV